MTHHIRAAEPRDEEGVLALVPRLEDFGLPANVPPGETARGEARTLRAVFAGIPDGIPDGEALLVAEQSLGPVEGFIFLETKVDYFTERPHGHVGILAVAKAAEGTGVGRALLEAGDAWARSRGYDRMTLFVFEGNARARRAYERAGYGADLVRYRKDLSPGRE